MHCSGGEVGWLIKLLEFPSCTNVEVEEWGTCGSIGQSWEGGGWHHGGEREFGWWLLFAWTCPMAPFIDVPFAQGFARMCSMKP